jgi:hypothetical protein
MLCSICGNIFKGSNEKCPNDDDEEPTWFMHHESEIELLKSAETGCPLCMQLVEKQKKPDLEQIEAQVIGQKWWGFAGHPRVEYRTHDFQGNTGFELIFRLATAKKNAQGTAPKPRSSSYHSFCVVPSKCTV